MTTTQLRQWFYMIPLLSIEKVRELFLFIVVREDPVAKAIETAREIAEVGTWKIRVRYQKTGVLCLGIGRKNRPGEIDYWVYLRPETHFTGTETVVPSLKEGEFVTFEFSLPEMGKVHAAHHSSYLKIKK